jgi:hypothetical protein
MPRKTRKQLVTIDEAREQQERDEFYRWLRRQLKKEWRNQRSVGALPEVEAYQPVLCNTQTVLR